MLKTKWLFIACGLQFVLILTMFINVYLPIYFGTEVKVIAQGYDPRDLLAGDFVQLDYGVELTDETPLNTEVFVRLEKINDVFILKEILTEPPKNTLYITAKTPKFRAYRLSLKDIERYFTTREKAQEIEKLLAKPNNQAIVTLKIFKGKARIVDLQVESKQ